MTRDELIKYCLTYADAVEDYPFDDKNNTIMRHKNKGKWFAIILELDNRLCINLKCEPMTADFLRSVYNDVLPGWHMNKVHWNTVRLGGDVPIPELYDMINQSFNLTKPKIKLPKKAVSIK